jgi:transcriptional regulator with XRE-family HTH domain
MYDRPLDWYAGAMGDPASLEPAPPAVGARVRELRESRRLSLRALSDRCGLSINAISLIERGRSSPTVSSLHALAASLGVPIVGLFQAAGARGVVAVARNRRLGHDERGVRMESLGTGLRDQQLAPFLFTLAPGAGGERPVRHPGQEFAHCLEGRVEYTVNGERHALSAGDSLLLESTLPHAFRNASPRRARLLVVFQAAVDADGAHLPHG